MVKDMQLSVSSFQNDVFLYVKIVLILSKIADPDEMQHDAAFHLGFSVCQSSRVSSINRVNKPILLKMSHQVGN